MDHNQPTTPPQPYADDIYKWVPWAPEKPATPSYDLWQSATPRVLFPDTPGAPGAPRKPAAVAPVQDNVCDACRQLEF
jgi:hypothetical protein